MPVTFVEFALGVSASMAAFSLLKPLWKKHAESPPDKQAKAERPEKVIHRNRYQTDDELDVADRLDVLDDHLYAGGPIGESTHQLQVKLLHTKSGVKYALHFHNRPAPFLVFEWNRETGAVTIPYLMDCLYQVDKKRTREIVKEYSKRIHEAHEVKPRTTKDVVLQRIGQLECSILQLESETAPEMTAILHGMKQSVEKTKAWYNPLTESSKERFQIAVLEELDETEDRLLAHKQNIPTT